APLCRPRRTGLARQLRLHPARRRAAALRRAATAGPRRPALGRRAPDHRARPRGRRSDRREAGRAPQLSCAIRKNSARFSVLSAQQHRRGRREANTMTKKFRKRISIKWILLPAVLAAAIVVPAAQADPWPFVQAENAASGGGLNHFLTGQVST